MRKLGRATILLITGLATRFVPLTRRSAMASRTWWIGLAALMLVALVVPSAVAIEGSKVQATVSFGQWKTDPPFDRVVMAPNTPTRNNHQLIPQEVKVKAGGAVNFIISGFHQPTIYDAGTQPGDIDTTPPGGFIEDSLNRIFRGVNPQGLSQDRVESVTFHKPGTYLVICGIKAHFMNDGMFGFVKVQGADETD
jgi:plastocyanin